MNQKLIITYRLDSNFFGGWTVSANTDVVRRELGAYDTLAEALDAIREYDKDAL